MLTDAQFTHFGDDPKVRHFLLVLALILPGRCAHVKKTNVAELHSNMLIITAPIALIHLARLRISCLNKLNIKYYRIVQSRN